MALVLANRVQETTTTTGTGTITLAGAVAGFQSFAVVGNGNTTYYTITSGSAWEVGIGTYSTAGPTLARTTILSSSAGGAAITLTGTSAVFVTYPAEDSVYQDGATIAAGTAVLGVTNGGTGVTTSTGTGSVVLSNSPVLVTPTLGAASATSVANGLGAVGTPSYTFTGDTNTGMFSPGADTIAFSEGGVEAMRIDSSGNVGIGTSAPGYLLQGVQNGNAEFRVSSTNAGTNSAGLTVENQGNRSWNLWANRATDKFIIGANNRANDFLSVDGSTGNVGIGTTAPDRKLDVQGSGSITVRSRSTDTSGVTVGILAAEHASGSSLQVRAGVGFTNLISTGAADPLILSTNSAERMRIDSSGNVGIGTSAPGAKLDVLGILLARTDASGGNAPLVAKNDSTANNTTKSTGLLFQGVDTVGTGKSTGLVQCGPSDVNYVTSYLAFQTRTADALSERMRITNTGNVGIGTTAPLTQLNVPDSILVTNNGGYYGGQAYYASGSWRNAVTGQGGYAIRNTSGVFTVYTGASTSAAGTAFTDFAERMSIASDGATTLSVGGVSSTHSFLYNESGGEIQLVDSTGAGPILLDNSGGLARFYKVGTGAMSIGTTGANFIQYITNGAERMRIDSSGNVGIGTSSPAQRLHVATTAAPSGTTQSFLRATADVGFGADFGGGIIQGVGPIATISTVSSGTATERMRIDSSGNVGIGTSSPGAKLDVSSSSFNIVASRSTGGYAAFQRIAPSGQQAYDFYTINGVEVARITADGANLLAFSTGSAAAERMRIDSSGNVGIGTTAPLARLFAQAPTGAGAAFSYIGNANGAYPSDVFGGSFGYNFSAGGAEVDFWNGWTGATGTQGGFAFRRQTGASSQNLLMTIQGDGNVGIGTSTPAQRLHVRQDQNGTTAALIQNRNGSGTPVSAVQFISGAFDLTDNRYAMISSAGGSNTTLQFWTGSGATPTERMRIDSSGNVGIGTSSPGTKLDVVGDIRCTNSMFLGAGQNLDNKIEIGSGRTGSNYAYIDLIGDTTYTDYGLRLIRGNGGANTTSQLVHRGTGDMYITTQDAATMYFQTNNTTRMYIEAGGTLQMNGALLVGRSSASTDVNTANDTGSFSVRGSSTTVASMSFHRAGAFAINMGLGTDNVFRIGGWSASSNAFQMDSGGNLTMLGNVTAYSDARIKKDVETIDSALDLVSKMRGVRYTRIDTKKRGVGVIAQEMLEVCPEVVQQGVGDDDTLSVAYGNLVGVLIEAVKELTARVAELEGK